MVIFRLSAEKAIAKIEEHVGLVKKHLGKPLHEVPFEDFVVAPGRVFHKQPDSLPISREGESLYSPYDLGNYLVLERIVSQLRAEKRLKKSH